MWGAFIMPPGVVRRKDKIMKELMTYSNDQFGSVRVFTDENGEAWFCGKDVLTALEYSESSNPAKVLQMVPE